MFTYGGYVQTGGTMEGRTWSGVNIMLAEHKEDELPTFAKVFKGFNSDTLMSTLRSLPVGCEVDADFNLAGNDRNGNPVFKVSNLRVIKK